MTLAKYMTKKDTENYITVNEYFKETVDQLFAYALQPKEGFGTGKTILPIQKKDLFHYLHICNGYTRYGYSCCTQQYFIFIGYGRRLSWSNSIIKL